MIMTISATNELKDGVDFVDQDSSDEDREYEHSVLPDVSGWIRLFKIASGDTNKTIHLTLSEHSYMPRNELCTKSHCEGDPQYIAVSYTWGPETPLKLIYVNGLPFLIRSNLHTVLLQLRRSGMQQMLWADALCINQTNIEERNAQVRIMGSIFKTANEIYAYIGPDNSRTTSLFAHMNEDDHFGVINPGEYGFHVARSNKKCQPRITTDDIDVLLDIWEQEYWSRTWIVQELCLSPDAVTIWCGASSVSFIKLRKFHHTAMSCLLSEAKQDIPGRDRDDVLGFLGTISTRFFDQSHSNCLSTLISHHANTYCADPRDKIYALRGLACDIDQNNLRPQYHRPVEALFWDVLGHVTKWYCRDLTDCGHHPIWKLLLQTLSLTINDLKQYNHSDGDKTLNECSHLSRHFSQILDCPARVAKVRRSTDSEDYCTIEARDHYSAFDADDENARHGNVYAGFTCSNAQAGDLLFRLKPASELSVIVRHSKPSLASTSSSTFELKFIGWAVTAGHHPANNLDSLGWGPPSARSWCFINGSMWTYQIDNPDPREWLPKKLAAAVRDLQQDCNILKKDAIIVQNRTWSGKKQMESLQKISLSMNVEALLALWAYAERPDRC